MFETFWKRLTDRNPELKRADTIKLPMGEFKRLLANAYRAGSKSQACRERSRRLAEASRKIREGFDDMFGGLF